MGTDFRFDFGFEFEVDGFNLQTGVFKSSFDNFRIASTELFDVKSVFYTDFDMAIFVREERGILEPG